MRTRTVLAAVLALAPMALGAATPSAMAQPPRLYAPDGTYLGNLSTNMFDPNSISTCMNPHRVVRLTVDDHDVYTRYPDRMHVPSARQSPRGWSLLGTLMAGSAATQHID
jgi:hypothetical protein